MSSKINFETKCISSLEKVFADENLVCESLHKGSAFLNETYSFQVAYRNNGELFKHMEIEVESALKDIITVRAIGLAPSDLPLYQRHDQHVLRTTPGLYPDPLYPIDEDGVTGLPNQWRSAWVSVRLNEQVKPGKHEINVRFKTNKGELLSEETFELHVLPAALPEQKLICTHWFHVDSLALTYNVDVFSDAHWKLLEQYIGSAVTHGNNMIYTPLFTPPLDTEVGGERLTVQLVRVEKNGSQYEFDFTLLTKWVELCQKAGMKYFEFSHLFTQWGSKHAPKIIATENGEEKKIFGWETDAAGVEYQSFLNQFLPKLVEYIKENKLEDAAYFHISDEPSLEHLESYQKASEIIYKHVGDYPIMDALSNYEFYEKGYVKHPIPANDHIEPFLENGVKDLWTYYCCVQIVDVANRFFAFPSARNRILGMQLYKYDIKGFLQWGYNFWLSQYSKRLIDPFKVTDADHGFPSGDAFLVYPGEEGPIASIRSEVFVEALQDLRAFELLGEKIGKEQVIELLEKDLDQAITFTEYPRDAKWLLKKREEINKKIEEVYA